MTHYNLMVITKNKFAPNEGAAALEMAVKFLAPYKEGKVVLYDYIGELNNWGSKVITPPIVPVQELPFDIVVSAIVVPTGEVIRPGKIGNFGDIMPEGKYDQFVEYHPEEVCYESPGCWVSDHCTGYHTAWTWLDSKGLWATWRADMAQLFENYVDCTAICIDVHI